jgi:two-component system CitB family sensor kinase
MKIKLETKIIASAILMTVLPLILSYIIFFNNQIIYVDNNIKISYLIFVLVVFVLVFIFSWKLSKNIKNSVKDSQFENIVEHSRWEKILLENIKEGIIALNSKDEVVDMNRSANEILKNNNKDKVGKALANLAKKRKPYYNREFILCNNRIFINLVPIIEDGKYQGSVITFVNKYEIQKVAREITGIDQVVNSLRANVHEFKNKLHVVMGFIQMKEYDEAKDYIMKLQRDENKTFSLVRAVEDHYINAILLAKGSIAKENGIDFKIENNSNLFENHGEILSDDLVVIVGNFLENAFEACMIFEDSENQVRILLQEDEERIRIEVFDTGIEISDDMLDSIFKKGVSTKGKGRGSGLSIVKDKIKLYNGIIEIKEEKTGKRFIVELYKELKDDKCSNS